MKEYNLFQNLIKRALLGGYYAHLEATVLDLKDDPESFDEFIDNMVDAIIETDKEYRYRLIFNPEFALAVGYTLSDLGGWMDTGGDPLRYLEKHIKRDENIIWIERQ